MRRRVISVMAGLSLFVCAASAVLIARSYVRVDRIEVPLGKDHSGLVYCVRGRLLLWHVTTLPELRYSSSRATDATREWFEWLWHVPIGRAWWGLGWGSAPHAKFLILSLWPVPVLTGALPLRWLLQRRRRNWRGFVVAGPHATGEPVRPAVNRPCESPSSATAAGPR